MECHASVSAQEETEEELDFQGLRYPNPSILLYQKQNCLQKLKPGCFVFQGSPGFQGSQGHPGDEGGPVSLNDIYIHIQIW